MRIPQGELRETIMILDQFGAPDAVLRELRGRLRWQDLPPVSRLFKKILLKRSRGETLIQCADMVLGALMRETNAGDGRFFNPVRDKIVVWRL